MAEVDRRIFEWINGFVGTVPAFDEVMKLVVSDYLVPVSLALCLLALWFSGAGGLQRRRYQYAIVGAVFGVAVCNLSIELLNDLYFRPRPFVGNEIDMLFYRPTDSSFPANSAAAAFAFAVPVWLAHRRLGTLMLAAGALFAFSRVYAGVHYPLDVIGGAAIGTAGAVIGTYILRLLRPLIDRVLDVARVFVVA